MKLCSKCKVEKQITEFGKNKSKKDGLQTQCSSCRRSTNAEYYQKTPERNQDRKDSISKRRDEAREFIWSVLKDSKCIDCGNDNPIVLDFDHVFDIKTMDISAMMLRGYTTEVISEEMAKCEIRCSNCHRIVTAERAGHWRVLFKELRPVE